jgi:hypothetical protein
MKFNPYFRSKVHWLTDCKWIEEKEETGSAHDLKILLFAMTLYADILF